MTYIIGIVSQKGGVGKSTLSRLLAREVAAGGANVKIADLDIQQGTSFKWASRRAANGITPEVRVETFANVKTALAETDAFEVYILDGAPHASKDTREVARTADLVVIPTGQSLDDLEPSVLLAHDLVRDGIHRDRIAFALCKVSDSAREVEGARTYLAEARYQVLEGEIPFRTGFSMALDQGRAVTETTFRTLAKRADRLAQAIIDAAASAPEREVA
jgi:chromosome partitioning protein